GRRGSTQAAASDSSAGKGEQRVASPGCARGRAGAQACGSGGGGRLGLAARARRSGAAARPAGRRHQSDPARSRLCSGALAELAGFVAAVRELPFAKGLPRRDPGSGAGKARESLAARAAVEKLVLGATARGGFVRFKADIPTTISKGAPDFCSVYVVNKGKVSSQPNSIRAAPRVSPLRSQIAAPCQASTGRRSIDHHPAIPARMSNSSADSYDHSFKMSQTPSKWGGSMHHTNFSQTPLRHVPRWLPHFPKGWEARPHGHGEAAAKDEEDIREVSTVMANGNGVRRAVPENMENVSFRLGEKRRRRHVAPPER
ncbi:hypothetical protein BAE44_0021909, partial [Dichanthelium oligosanthes]